MPSLALTSTTDGPVKLVNQRGKLTKIRPPYAQHFFSSLKEFTKGRRYFVTVIKVGTKSVSSVRRAYTKPSVDIFDRGKSSASSWEFIL